jgi:hypothetical protein
MEGVERPLMPVPRRDFIKLFGISLGSMLLARCSPAVASEPTYSLTCYQPTAVPRPTGTPTPESVPACARLRLCWLKFGELAQKTREGTNSADGVGNPLGTQMISEHRSALDELIPAGGITLAVADLVQEAYAAAVYHVWRTNIPTVCYDLAYPDYTIAGADELVRQVEILNQVAAGGTIAPDTLAKARAALEHDLAFYALTEADVQALYDRLVAEYSDPGEHMPAFEELQLTLTADVRAAAQFLIDVLMGD